MSIAQAILVLLSTVVFAVAWRCMRPVNTGPGKLGANGPDDTTEAIVPNGFLDEMWEDMGKQCDPTIPGSQAWLASRANDATDVGSTAWILAQSVSQDLDTDPHVHERCARQLRDRGSSGSDPITVATAFLTIPIGLGIMAHKVKFTLATDDVTLEAEELVAAQLHLKRRRTHKHDLRPRQTVWQQCGA